MNAYRSDARVRRKRIIKLAPSVLRLLGIVVGPLVMAFAIYYVMHRRNPVDAVFGAIIVALGAAILVRLVNRFPRRRLVLDEEANVVQLESRSLFRWRAGWAIGLEELREVSTAHETRDVVLTTRNDERVTIVEDSLRDDDEVARAVDEFLARR